ncbi:hypothetical protein LWI29_016667 [Acer saccharum]|uniref:Uncharacterized protein n=1 Tax=Acer saccharum TaxID=4024 RepID=A0AA39W6G0_ACESA|nr:hypothetical protein LWI29_016667 [Acer saccharum]
MIMSWLWNSMQPEISGTYMFLTIAKDIWEAAKQCYSKVQFAAQIYELKTKISSTKQGSLAKSGRRLVMLENKTREASALAAKRVMRLPQMGGGNGAEMGRNSKEGGKCGSKDSDEYIFESLDLESEPNSTIELVVELVKPKFVNESVSVGNENETTTQPLQVYIRWNKSILPLPPTQASTPSVSPNMELETKTHIHIQQIIPDQDQPIAVRK